MKSLTLRTMIAADGTIDLHLPSGLPPGEAEIVIVVQPLSPAMSSGDGPSYRSDHGVWRCKLSDADIDADLRELNRLWERGIDLLE